MEEKEIEEMWFITDPDSEEWDEEYVDIHIKYYSKMWNVQVFPTGYTRDCGFGQERKFIIEGSPENIEGFLESFNEAF